MDLQSYLNEIGRHPVLTKEAQLRHCRRIHAWCTHPEGRDNAPLSVTRAGQRSMATMTRTNLRLVVAVAKKYQNRGLELPDLIQEGSLGLIRGLELYDPARGYALSTYVYWWIRQAIVRALHTQARMIRLPINAHELLSKVTGFVHTFNTEHGRHPTTPEVAAALDITTERVDQLFELCTATTCASLDAHAFGCTEGHSIGTLIPNEDETPSNSPEVWLTYTSESDFAQAALSRLPAQEARVMRSMYVEDKTMATTAKEMSLSRAQVHQLRNTALLKLKHYMFYSRFR